MFVICIQMFFLNLSRQKKKKKIFLVHTRENNKYIKQVA